MDTLKNSEDLSCRLLQNLDNFSDVLKEERRKDESHGLNTAQIHKETNYLNLRLSRSNSQISNVSMTGHIIIEATIYLEVLRQYMTLQTDLPLLLKTHFTSYFASLCVSAPLYLSNILICTQKALDIAKHLRYRHLQTCFLVRFRVAAPNIHYLDKIKM